MEEKTVFQYAEKEEEQHYAEIMRRFVRGTKSAGLLAKSTRIGIVVFSVYRSEFSESEEGAGVMVEVGD